MIRYYVWTHLRPRCQARNATVFQNATEDLEALVRDAAAALFTCADELIEWTISFSHLVFCENPSSIELGRYTAGCWDAENRQRVTSSCQIALTSKALSQCLLDSSHLPRFYMQVRQAHKRELFFSSSLLCCTILFITHSPSLSFLHWAAPKFLLQRPGFAFSWLWTKSNLLKTLLSSLSFVDHLWSPTTSITFIMWLFNVLLLVMVNFGAMAEIPMCGSQSTSSQTSRGCTMTFTPYMAPQIGPTSTVYGAIMTTYFYVCPILP